jgi:hypothetical protein
MQASQISCEEYSSQSSVFTSGICGDGNREIQLCPDSRRLALSSTMALFLVAVSFGQHYTQTNLQANTPGVAEATDPQLVNSWGLSRTFGSAWWVADNAIGVATLYNGQVRNNP